MTKRVLAGSPSRRVVLCDSITEIDGHDRGAFVVTGSHGGVSAARFAEAVPLALAVFNDAGVGKDRAGIAALDVLEQLGIPAATVSHLSARIGEAEDTWANGIVSHVNARAAALGLVVGASLQSLLKTL